MQKNVLLKQIYIRKGVEPLQMCMNHLLLLDQIFNVKLLKEETIRRRAGDGDDYSVQSMLRAVATRHTPQRLGVN